MLYFQGHFEFLLHSFISELPTYEEAMDKFDAGDDSFKPKYPVFKRRTSYSTGL